MKIGDKVRFLNEVGGGVITGIKEKGIVLVSDENGFEIPTLAKDVVVVETDDYNIAKVHTITPKDKQGAGKKEAEQPRPTSVKQALAVKDEAEEDETDITEKEVTYRPRPQMRRGAEKLNLLIAFVPTDPKRMAETPLEVYLVNDCNYNIHFSLLSRGEGDTVTLLHDGELAANTKLFLEETERAELPKWESIALQAVAYKRGGDFLPKPAVNVAVRVEGAKFYKLHAFTGSDFFNTPALQVFFVKDDRAVHTGGKVDTHALQERMREGGKTPGAATPARRARTAVTEREDGTIVADLHADELLDDFSGLDPADILEHQLKVFRETLDAHLGENGRRIVFVHGKGDGVLRNAILRELSKRYRQCRWQDASFREYGYGATLVITGEDDKEN